MFSLCKKGVRYVHRVPPTAVDFTKNSFIWDAVCRELDLSSIVPANAKLVHISVEFKSTDDGNYIGFTSTDDSEMWVIKKTRTQVANIAVSSNFNVALSTPQTISYFAKLYSGEVSNLEVMILGWWI